MARPFLILVSGPPGSGKTTLAHQLGRLVPCPVISQDEVLQGLRNVGTGEELVVDEDLINESFYVFFLTVRNLLLGNVSVVAEAAFPVGRWERDLEPLCGLAQGRLVLCRADADHLAQRMAQRATVEPGGLTALVAAELLVNPERRSRLFEDYGPMDLVIPRFDVDTNAEYDPPLRDVLHQFGVRTRMATAA